MSPQPASQCLPINQSNKTLKNWRPLYKPTRETSWKPTRAWVSSKDELKLGVSLSRWFGVQSKTALRWVSRRDTVTHFASLLRLILDCADHVKVDEWGVERINNVCDWRFRTWQPVELVFISYWAKQVEWDGWIKQGKSSCLDLLSAKGT